MHRWLLPTQSLVLSIVLTWPAVAVLGSRAVGSPQADVPKHLWTLWWMRTEIWDGVPGLQTNWANYPKGMKLWPIEPLNGLLSLVLPLDPVPLSNLLALLHVLLLGLCAGWLGGLVSGRRSGALVAGALAQASAFTALTLHLGVGELRQFWWIPLGLGCLMRAREGMQMRWFLALGATMGLATLSCFYHGLFLAISAAVYALLTLGPLRRCRPLLAGYAVAAILAVLLVALPVKTFAQSYDPDHNTSQASFAQRGREARHHARATYTRNNASLDELVLPARFKRTATPSEGDYGGGRYLGLGVLLLAGVGVAAAPRRAAPWVAVAATGAVLALGTDVYYDGALVTYQGYLLRLPLAYINPALTYVAEPVNFPSRFLAISALALAVTGALATRWRLSLLLVPFALVDTVANDLVPFPRATFAFPDTTNLAAGAGTGAVANLSPFAHKKRATEQREFESVFSHKERASRIEAIAAQLTLRRPFEIIPVERVEHWASEGLVWVRALPLADAMATPDSAPVDMRESWWLLRDAGFDRVLVTHPEDARPDLSVQALLTKHLGPPFVSRSAELWPVPEVTATSEETSAWISAQAKRVATVQAQEANHAAPL